MHTQQVGATMEGRIRAAIVDGETVGRERIRQLLDPEPDVKVVGEYRDARAAASGILASRPDLLFLDIQMPRGSAFSILENLGPHPLPATVFVTADDCSALWAFEMNAVDYLLKPLESERFRRSLDRARHYLGTSRPGIEDPPRTPAHPAPLARLAVKARDKILLLRLEDVVWIDAAGNYVRLHVNGQTHHFRETLSNFEVKLDPGRFVRVHRSVIVNIDRIVQLEPSFRRDHVIVLRDGTRLRLSAPYRAGMEALVGRF
jgi:two-component system LytT family response regulator